MVCMCVWGEVGEDTRDEEGLDNDVSRGAPGSLPGSNVDVDEVHFQ